MSIRITDDGDETCFVIVNEETIATINHEDFGWSGMRQVINLVQSIGETFNIPVYVEQSIV